MIETALFYKHQLGLSVIPQKNKVPLVAWEEFMSRIATDEEIKAWWTNTPDAGISAVMGTISKMVVIDCDSPEAVAEIEKEIPDSITVPCVATPRGGRHYYFACDRAVQKRVGFRTKMDLQAERATIVMPPSRGPNGRSYEWIIKPNSRSDFADLHVILSNTNSLYSNVTESKDGVLQAVTIDLNKGKRDDSLFHIGSTMSRGGAKIGDVNLVLKLLAKHCKPPFPEKEVDIKIKSILDRVARKERNLMKELDCYIGDTDGGWAVTDCYKALQVVTTEDKTAIRVGINRRKGKTIEKYGDRDGWYRKIKTDIQFITFDDDEKDEDPFPIKLPLGLNDLVEISEGNIIVVAGEFNAGKTLFMLNVLQMNKNRVPVRYITSEMSKSEFKKRFKGFTSIPRDFWKQDDMTDYVRQSMDFHTILKPDGINIIDYVEFIGADFTQGAEIMRLIHDALNKGVAIVAVQKKTGAALPRSGDLILEKARLGISLSKMPGKEEKGVAEVLKAKDVKLGKCDGKKLIFEMIRWGSEFNVLNDWGYYRV